MNAPIKTQLTDMLGMDYPVILAPMFLINNAEMMIAGLKSGIAVCIPAHNYRTIPELKAALKEIKAAVPGKPLGVNLITNKSNFRAEEQLQACIEAKIDFFITSLGSPRRCIEEGHKHGIKVLCDIIDLDYAKRVVDMGCDAIIAVTKEAGGHAGYVSYKTLIPELKKTFDIPVIAAGGVGLGSQLRERLDLGAVGISMGSPFIATTESPVSQEYKQACVDYGAKDIVSTTKLSGTPCTVINTPYVQKIGTEQSAIGKFLNKNKKLKKWVKGITFLRGMKSLEKAAFSATYKTLWCAGPSIEHTTEIKSVKDIVDTLIQEYHESASTMSTAGDEAALHNM